MKVFLSSDVEGTCGIAAWDEAGKGSPYYTYFAEQMTKEVAAACNGAHDAGADEILIKDAHDSARNINPQKLPEFIKICRGWTGFPCSMMSGLDESFDAVMFTGYHSGATYNTNPLSHTMSTSLNYMKLNGKNISEFVLNSYMAAYYKVPVVFISGDKGICSQAKEYIENIETVAVNEGIGGAVISIHPDLAVKKIRETVEKALKSDIKKCLIKLPEHFNFEISFKEHTMAYHGKFYPGAKLINNNTIGFESDDYMEVMKFMAFTM